MADTITFSSASTFQRCEWRYRLRYGLGLQPIERAEALWFGGLWHDVKAAGLARLPFGADKALAVALATIDGFESLAGWQGDPGKRAARLKLEAMAHAYARRWWDEPAFGEEDLSDRAFEIIGIEVPFDIPITTDLAPVDPVTGEVLRVWKWRGLVDDVRRRKSDGSLWLGETKTAASVDSGYLERLWTDLQIHLYSRAVEQEMGESVVGVVYDIVLKSRMTPREEKRESAEDFAKRLAGYKRAETAVKHKAKGPKIEKAETDEEFAERLEAFYSDPDSLHRELLLLDRAEIGRAENDLAEVVRRIDERQAGGRWLRNTGACFPIGWAPCPFHPVCKAGGEPDAITRNAYVTGDPHPELTRSGKFEDLVAATGVDNDKPF